MFVLVTYTNTRSLHFTEYEFLTGETSENRSSGYFLFGSVTGNVIYRPNCSTITRPQGNTPPPFTCGILAHRNRRYFAACMQLATRHCFDAGYSLKFRANAGDEVHCPCNFSQHLDDSAVGSGPTRGRTDTEAGSQRNAGRTTLDFDTLQCQFLDPNDDGGDPEDPPSHLTPSTLYTYHHVLTDCPQTAT